jgi:hypothetical protein
VTRVSHSAANSKFKLAVEGESISRRHSDAMLPYSLGHSACYCTFPVCMGWIMMGKGAV